MTKHAFIFPGQGSQFIGMGRDLAEAFPESRAVFEEVNEALGQDLSGLMWTGEEAELTLTSNTQPALMAVSVAAIRALESHLGSSVASAAYVAGHSLGEYSALAAAGAMSVGDCARVLRVRGDSMQAAVPRGEGAMAALLGASPEQADALCKVGAARGICEIANDNAPGQIVLSGTRAAIEAACDAARDHGVKKAVQLPVSAPFHCSLMQPAADAVAEILASTEVRSPASPVIANVTAQPVTDPATIRGNLITQVTGQVRWRESVEFMAEAGVTLAIESGAGKVLTVMNRRTVRDLDGMTMGTPEEVEAVAKRLSGE